MEKNSLFISSPSTVYVSFTDQMPRVFVVYMSNGTPYYFRHMDGKTPRIKFNIPDPGSYYCSVPIEVVKKVLIEIPPMPRLPAPERDRYKGDPTIVYDPNWTVSPASNFTEENIIIHGPRWKAEIPAVRLFIDLHEMGHFFYRSEENCDLYAFVNFMRMGYNRSTAYYAMSKVLKISDENIARIKKLFQTINKTTGEFDPGS